MKKIAFIQISIFLFITLAGCNVLPPEDNLPIEMIAFNSLTKPEQELIPVSPKDSIVKKINVNDENKSFIDKDYDKYHVYAVIFNNTENASSGKLTVFVDMDKETVVGKGFTGK